MSNDELVRSNPSDLQLRLCRGLAEVIRTTPLEPGTHLKEQPLAARFEVSRTPLRGALALLARGGLVEQRSNRGYFVAETPELAVPELPPTEQERLYARVAKDWLERSVDEQFSEQAFRRRYGIGRAAASRVLLKLAEDGVIARCAGRGWRFEPTLDTRCAHDESYRFRIVLEPAAIELDTFELDQAAAERLRRRHVDALDGDDGNLSISSLFELDAEFHLMIAACTHNRFFLNAMQRQNRLRRLVEYASLLDADRLVASCSEHLGILDQLEAGDRCGAARLMRDHLVTASGFAPLYRLDAGPHD